MRRPRFPDEPGPPRAALAQMIPRRAGAPWWAGVLLAVGFAALVTPAITAEHWLLRFRAGTVTEKRAAPFTVRAPLLAGYDNLRVGGGVVVARGETATRDEATIADAIADATPRGPAFYLAFAALTFALAAIVTHHMRRSTKGRLARVQIVSLLVIAALAAVVKIILLTTALSALVVPVAVFSMVPTLVLDRTVGLATGVLAAVVVSLLGPFDVGLAILLLVQATTAGLVIPERPKRRWLPALSAGLATTLSTSATYLLLMYLLTGHPPGLADPLHSPWVAAAIGPALATLVTVPLVALYQLLVGEITHGRLIALEDLGHPLLRHIADRSPGTWQHSLMMANMAEIAANAVGANARLVRVGAYFHDLGKSLSPKYFIENLEAGETSPHDQLPPEVSCDAIIAHVTEGIAAARKARLHERIVDFMHMHHGNGVLEYFWTKCQDQGNPHQLTIEQFRYPGHPPQSRETAILAICDAVEAASRTLRQPDPAAIDSLVQRIVYGKLHLGQLDESGLSMSDLRRISDSLRETIRHANHGRIEYPWQKAGYDASAMAYTATSPRLDSLDGTPARMPDRTPAGMPARDTSVRPAVPPPPSDSDAALAATADVKRNAYHPGPPATEADTVGVRAQHRHPEDAGAERGERATRADRASVERAVASGGLAPPPDLITPNAFARPGTAQRKHPQTLPLSPERLGQSPGAGLRSAMSRPGSIGHPPVPPDAAKNGGRATTQPAAVRSLGSMPLATIRDPGSSPEPVPVRARSTAGGAELDDAPLTSAVRTPPRVPSPAPGASSDRRSRELDTGATEPSLPAITTGDPPRTPGMAARIDAALDSDEWGRETPIVALSRDEMLGLLDEPEPTRMQSIEELEQLHRRAAKIDNAEPPRRSPHPTAEVDPDDIEAAIELAPPARRPTNLHALGIIKPKKTP